jgi:hypothetical protein
MSLLKSCFVGECLPQVALDHDMVIANEMSMRG